MMKAIPTNYRGAMFRSRLEARWAAFFDIYGFYWNYEPIDFEGWCPDFAIHHNERIIYCEVKPFDLNNRSGSDDFYLTYEKAFNHYPHQWIMLLGLEPYIDNRMGYLLDLPAYEKEKSWADMVIKCRNSVYCWNKAGSLVQWKGRHA